MARKPKPPPEPPKIGRPTKRSPELDTKLVEWLESGKTMRSWCAANDVNATTVYDWIDADPDLSQRVARARRRAEQSIEDEIADIADKPSDHDDDVQHRKLQLWAREKRLVWSNAAKYGTKTQIGGAADLPPLKLTDEDRAMRIQQLLTVAKQREEQEKNNGTTEPGAAGPAV